MRKIACAQCPTRERSLAADLPPAELDAFRACSIIGIYRARQVVLHEGAPATGLHLICRGAVKLYQADRFGREHIVGIAGPGEIVGELGLDPREPCSVSAEAVVDSQLCFLPREQIGRFLQLHPSAGLRLVAALGKALGDARRKARDLALKPAEARIADLLLQLAGLADAAPGGGPLRLTLAYSRREIAEMVGVSTETAIRLLGRLKERGLLAMHGREVVFIDVERLCRVASSGDLDPEDETEPSTRRA